MKRLLALLAFAALLWQAAPPNAWTRSRPTPVDERTYETSRTGFEAIEYPGPLTRSDIVRLMLRREGDFHLPLTVNFRKWRLADPPDLWKLEAPGTLKLHVRGSGIEVVAKPERLRLGVGETFNLPLIIRNDLGEQPDLKIIATIDDAGPSDRFALRKGLTFASLNLRPTKVGSTRARLRFFVGTRVPEQGSPPESRIVAETSFPLEVVAWGKLRLRTVENGRPVAARVYARASDSLAYAPGEQGDQATLARITWTAGDYFFYSRGEHLLRLPAGQAKVEAVRGFEYRPALGEVEIRAGETAELTLSLDRFSNLGDKGWWGADSHIHANYDDHEFITPEDVLVQALGEDLNVSNLMVANSSGAQIHDEQYFEGRPHKLSRPRHVLRWIEEMRSAFYGHMCLPGIRSLVKPLYTGFRDTAYNYDYPPNHYQALGAQKAGGVASYAHPAYHFPAEPYDLSASELPVDLALGSVEAMDVLSNSNEVAGEAYYYRLLNTGLKCAISAGSDSFTNERHHWIPGGQRVYVYTGGPLDYREWIDGYRAGRSFATNGPILEFTVNGEAPGAELALSNGAAVRLEASAQSLTPMERLEIVRNGEVVASAEGPGPLRIEQELKIEEGCWLAARVRGPFHRYLVNDTRLYAHSSPVYVTVDGKKVGLREDAEFFKVWIDKLINGVQTRGRFENEGQRRETVELFRKARRYYEQVAAR